MSHIFVKNPWTCLKIYTQFLLEFKSKGKTLIGASVLCPLHHMPLHSKYSFTFLWSFFQVRNGHIKRITDNDIQSLVLEIVGTNVR